MDAKNAIKGALMVPAMCAAVLAGALPVVQHWEDTKLVPYLDIVGKLTGCSGVTEGIESGRQYSPAECATMDLHALAKIARGIQACVPNPAPLNVQIAVLVTAYNIGSAAFCGSTISRLLKAGDYRGACNAISSWDKIKRGGKLVVSRGLVNRRKAERSMCLSGIPA